ncbi:hypothetical protein ACFU76_12425 [Streptomyces sp. NPDC057539]|uniref:hypothetical protein n=1 Tax=Streptomyces sp. NPDC057539 TaxID=3346159 RepID=UPI0036A813D9
MAIEVTSDEDGTEYTESVRDYLEPAPEPLRCEHHSNVCGCPGERFKQNVHPETGEPYPFSTEPPFPPGMPHPAGDIGPEPELW